MADLLDVALIKQQIRSDRDDEDDYLAILAGAAIAHFEEYTGRTLVAGDTVPDTLVDGQVPMYLSIQQGLLLLIAHWYENRELSSEKILSEAPAATYILWSAHQWYHLGDVEDDGESDVNEA